MPTKPAVKKKATHRKSAVHKAPARKRVAHRDEVVEKVAIAKPAHVAQNVNVVKEVSRTRENYKSSVGRRKTAIARVRYYDLGTGEMSINGTTLDKYFGFPLWVDEARSPLTHTGWAKGRWLIKAQGGGKHSQAQAVRHGISRMLILLEPELRATIKPLGFLTRDARVKERKKYGLKRARRAPQWQKR